METVGPRTRPLTSQDVSRILEIQSAAYAPHLLENGDVFAAKIESAPRHCVGALDRTGELIAYVIAFPMGHSASVGLHETAARASITEDGESPILYIHDLAVHPDAHGSGAGTAILTELVNIARAGGQSVFELVAIESAVGFWKHRGFAVVDAEVYPGYGPGARKMRRAVNGESGQPPQRD